MDIKALLRELELRPHKELGQNFLVDRHVLRRILAAAQVGPLDTVLEIGSGLGTLTEALAECAHRVIAVEVDQNLVAVLEKRLAPFANVEIIPADILSLDISRLLQEKDTGSVPVYKVVANIPYYITSAVMRHLLETAPQPQLIVLMLQKEVAQRITAKPGQMSLLAVSVQFYGQPRLIARVPASAFYPVPKVDSAIVRIDPHEQLPLERDEVGSFFEVVRAGFAQRRKQLRNALVHGLGLSMEHVTRAMREAGIDEQRRAQTLSISEWVALYRALKGKMDEDTRQA
ncbi:MAG: 16S rRNA (adenine(1518)-N(6)/adenine(1519)-N(6))-dimethyltransferase RsmA [Chloroflexi bacterium]|nr:16S rRNA (adenine(1518)-N(6)/adenine(1519)-N(6))-dimethyltransferase RsmA [Chloroflexota bacterium]